MDYIKRDYMMSTVRNTTETENGYLWPAGMHWISALNFNMIACQS